ncbi:hypothetical protein SAMN05428988_4657 [Chitinophaga sp. YR573]|uniref:hypothetical protein n=1 Tax=Chitinophaga sp. YR573 TaxID=1881040 RepID=UPI0008C6F8A9|nr:hypothetical protein [Chitinophaga sp. YR573]SEW37398.1 hypothetical protein SAMN05428988_4657 [Chitinophaga sp. YR573]
MKYVLFVFALIALKSSAQKYTFVESPAEVKDYLHKFFTTASGKYVDVQYAAPHGAFKADRDEKSAIVAVYDHQLKQLFSKSLSVTEGKTYEDGYSLGNKIVLLFSEKGKAVSAYELNPEDGTAKLASALFSGEDEYTNMQAGLSPDSALSYVICRYYHKKEPNTYTGVILDKQLHIVSKISASDEDKGNDIGNVQFALSNEGVFNIITAVSGSDSKKDYNPFNYTVQQINTNGKKTTGHLTGVPKGLFSDISFQAAKNELSFTGFITSEKNGRVTDVVAGVYDGVQKKITQSKKSSFEDEIGNTATFMAYHKLKDNSTIIIMQEGHTNSNTTTSYNPNGGFQSGYSRTSITIVSGDLYVIKLNSNNELAWMKTVHKNQWEGQRYIYTGTVSLVDKDDNLHLFFQDCLKNTDLEDPKPPRAILPGDKKHGLAIMLITKDGKMTKKFVDSFDKSQYSDCPFSTVDAITEGRNRVIYTSYDYKNIGRSRYHLATVTVE